MTHTRGLLAFVVAAAAASRAAAQIRSINGSGNAPDRPSLNAAGAPFQAARVYYADGISSIDPSLPNARAISTAIFSTGPFVMNRFSVAATVVAWGQFVAHDVILTTPQPGAPGGDVLSVAVPASDTGLDPTGVAGGAAPLPLTITRTVYSTTSGSSPANPRRQLNMATGWLDGSTVYGHTDARARSLRALVGGLLLADPVNGVPLNDGAGGCLDMEHPGVPSCGLRLAGDPRANVAPGILALHGIFVLSHNWWARRLAAATPGLSDETLYQEARKRVMAEIQAITFQEYAPVILGQPLPAYPGYQQALDPGVTPAFAIGAYRYGHSGINSIYLCLEADGSECSIGHLVLRDVFFRPAYLNFTGIVQILRGMTAHPESSIDTRMVTDVRNSLEGVRNDLAVMDIMRGRDFGLPSFSQARADAGLPRPVTFADITSDLTVAAALAAVYNGNVSAVELWVGGLAESATANTFIGPTFAAIIRDQFIRLRDGDRLFYNNPLLTGPDGTGRYLPLEDLRTVTQSRLSTIVARVTGWTNPPVSMFAVSSPQALLAGAAPPAPTASPAPGATRRVLLGPAITVDWTPPAAGDTSITLTVTLASGAGWAGVGLGEAMTPLYAAGDGVGTATDMWLLTFGDTGGVATDASALTRTQPARDAQQDLTLVSSTRSATSSSWTLRRALVTGDASDRPIVAGPMRIVYAWSATSAVVAYHGVANRGVATLAFIPTDATAASGGAAAADGGAVSPAAAGVISAGVIVGVLGLLALAVAFVVWRRRAPARGLAGWPPGTPVDLSVPRAGAAPAAAANPVLHATRAASAATASPGALTDAWRS